MSTKILIAIDEPEQAKTIVEALYDLVDKDNSEITLFNAIETTITEENYFYNEPEKFIKHEAGKSVFSELENFLENSCVKYRGFLYREGDAAKNILKLEHEYDLIVVGSHNKNPIERILLGSVAYKVIKSAKTSVLVINSKYLTKNNQKQKVSVLMGIDLSENSVYSAENLYKFVDKNKAEVSLLHVNLQPSLIIPPDAYIYIDMAKIIEETNKVSEDLLNLITNKLEETGLNVEKKYYLEGDAASEIIDEAKKNNNDLIVLGSHGESGIGKWLIGSVSLKVAEHAKKSVLIIKRK